MARPNGGRTRAARRNGPQRVTRSASVITREQVQKQLASKPLGKTLNNSDDSDDLVVAAPGSRNRKGVARREIYGSGGLGDGDTPQAYKRAQAEKSKASLARSPSATSSATRRVVSVAKATRVDHATSSPLTSMPTSTPPKSILRKPSGTFSRGNSLEPNNGVKATSQCTPGPAKGSFSDLKPRKRQPSLLAGLRQDTTNLGDSTFDATGLDEFDDILPNDESTPLNAGKISAEGRTSISLSQPSTSIAGRKRKITTPNGETASHVGSTRKRLSTERQLSPSPLINTQSRSPSLPRMRERVPAEHDDEIYAPPQSSSSPVRITADSPRPRNVAMQNSPKLQEKSRPTRRQRPSGQSKITTEALQALLPSRKQSKKFASGNEFDIPSDSSQGPRKRAVDEENEESFIPAQKLRKARSGKDASRGLVKSGGRITKGPMKQATSQGANRKVRKGPSPVKATPLQDASKRSAAKSSQQQEKAKVTYSSRRLDISAEDKENQPYGIFSGSSLLHTARRNGSPKTKDLVIDLSISGAERKKWADIDAFSLDFEEVSSENLGGSSPLRA
ncbi:hypothetical protein UCRPC4_g06713 [Phaeomoniella chlamydospora]|uniref:Uncharacterized protein n=1 Tax=Phaeomoniella chlamydospora TaxID=158046 RepID=A0A0G2DVA0_PHACM|nr:hypothetical protein UCRPC4_g06713 [Phaeomoniella chlamydospora]